MKQTNRRTVAGLVLGVIVMFLSGIHQVWAHTVYTDISLAYYNRFFNGANTENFQRYHTLKTGYRTDKFDINFNFNLFEDVDGPVADHNITPYTLESTWHLSDHQRLEANTMFLVDVYDKPHWHIETLLETRYRHTWPASDWRLSVFPILRLSRTNSWQLQPSLGASAARDLGKGQFTLGLNDLDIKDYAIFSRGSQVLTARVQWPTWGKTQMSIALNYRMSPIPEDNPLPYSIAEHQEQLWLDIRVLFDYLAAFSW